MIYLKHFCQLPIVICDHIVILLNYTNPALSSIRAEICLDEYGRNSAMSLDFIWAGIMVFFYNTVQKTAVTLLKGNTMIWFYIKHLAMILYMPRCCCVFEFKTQL